MHRCCNHTNSCLQVSASLASESLNVSAMVVSAAIVASATLANDTLQASAWADKPIQVDARSLTSPLKVIASLVCDVEDSFLRVSPDVVWFAADDLDGANFEIQSNVAWRINIPQIEVVSTVQNNTLINNESLLMNGTQSQEEVDWLLNSTLIRNETMIRDVSTLVRAELSNSILLTNKHYLRNAI